MSRQDALRTARECVAHARSLCDDVQFSPEDATRSDPDFLCEVLQAVVDSGATTLNIPDTVGYTMPAEYERLIRKICQTVQGENLVISSHCHNDLGMAVANSLAAVAAGARQVECTINGIGERAGNAALEELVMALHVRPDVYPFSCAVDRTQLYPASQMLSRTLGFNVQPNKAIVGRNAFAHEAGIHQHGVLSNPLCYEIMTPDSVGMPVDRLVLGKHSGRHALMHRFTEFGLNVAGDELDALYAKFTHLADRKKKVYDQDLISMVLTHRGPLGNHPIDGGATIMKLNIAVLPGDGVGPEVTREAVRVLRAVSDFCGYDFRFEESPIGGGASVEFGSPFPPQTRERCLASECRAARRRRWSAV